MQLEEIPSATTEHLIKQYYRAATEDDRMAYYIAKQIVHRELAGESIADYVMADVTDELSLPPYLNR
jgi:hypothetical protein